MSYIEIVKSEDGITLKLTPAGREELKALYESPNQWKKSPSTIFADMLEDWLANGWEFILPEEVGALTSSPILSEEVERNGDGIIVNLGRIYWFPDYAIRSELDELYENGEVFFPAAKETVNG